MLDNTTYNLMLQLVQEHKSLYRIKEYYLEDCQDDGDDEASSFWKRMEKDKEEHINELKELINERLS